MATKRTTDFEEYARRVGVCNRCKNYDTCEIRYNYYDGVPTYINGKPVVIKPNCQFYKPIKIKTIPGTIQDEIIKIASSHYMRGIHFDEGWRQVEKDLFFMGFASKRDEVYFMGIYEYGYEVEGERLAKLNSRRRNEKKTTRKKKVKK
jgi:hypothetical protein